MSEKEILEVPGPIERRKSRFSIITVDMSKLKSLGNLPRASSKNVSRLKVRRKSFGFGGVAGVRPLERTSQVGLEFKRPVLAYLNTYQLNSYYPFNNTLVEEAIDQLLDEHFTKHKYNSMQSPALALQLSCDIMHKVKEMQFNRYRIISVVTLGQKRAQSYNNAIAFLWDHERDSYVNVQRELTTAFIQVTVFGIYLD